MAIQHQRQHSWIRKWKAQVPLLARLTCGILVLGVSSSSGLLAHTSRPGSAQTVEPSSIQVPLQATPPVPKATPPVTQATPPIVHPIPSSGMSSPRVLSTFGKLPLQFEENQGQTDPQVKFLSRGRGYTMFLTDTEAVLVLRSNTREASDLKGDAESITLRKEPVYGKAGAGIQTSSDPSFPQGVSGDPGKKYQDGFPLTASGNDNKEQKTSVLRMSFTGANKAPTVTGKDKLPGIVNYFIGNDPDKWRTKIPTYKKVHYENLYEGIDLAYYGNQGMLEYDLMVAPGADPKQIKLAFEGEGIDGLSVNDQGDLVLSVNGGDLRLLKPHVYQAVNGKKVEIVANYTLKPESSHTARFTPDTVGIHLASYDTTKSLIIDPVLFFSTYLGGSALDAGGFEAVAVDRAGSIYVGGQTLSLDFPTVNPLDGTCGTDGTCDGGGPTRRDAFLVKLNAKGDAIVYSTYLGGSGLERPLALNVDSAGNLYVVGDTQSTDFPTANPIDSTCGTDGTCNGGIEDGFILKLGSSPKRVGKS